MLWSWVSGVRIPSLTPSKAALTSGFTHLLPKPPLLVLASLNSPAGPAAAGQQADALAAKLEGFAGVAAVTPPKLDQARTAALIDVIPSSAPSAPPIAALVTSLRDQAGTIRHATGAAIAVTGTTAIEVDVSAKLSAALLPFAAIVVGLSLLLLMLVFRSLLVPVKAAVGFLLSVGASLGATVAVFQWGWLAGPLGVSVTGPVASFLPIVVMAVLFGLAMDSEVFLASRIRENYIQTRDPRHAVVAGGAAAARVVVAAAVIMTSIFASFLLSADTTIKSLALALATGVACDALVVADQPGGGAGQPEDGAGAADRRPGHDRQRPAGLPLDRVQRVQRREPGHRAGGRAVRPAGPGRAPGLHLVRR